MSTNCHKQLSLVILAALAMGTTALAAGPTLAVRDIVMPAGRTFTQPLDGADPQGLPLTFSVVSISDAHVAGALTNGNRSVRLAVAGVDRTGTAFAGDLVLELFEDLTPLTAARIIQLVNSGFYDGLTFHRVIQNFMAQGGDPLGNSKGGSGQTLDDELVGALSFTGYGQLAMANSGHDTSDSQFFITDPNLTLGDATRLPPRWLDFNYTIFGQLTHGFDVLTKVLSTSVIASNNLPVTPVVISRATVFTNTQAAVLHLQAAAGFTGTVAVVVQATSASGLATQQTFQVTVIPNAVNDPPFFGPIPTSVVTTANAPVSFVMPATDLNGFTVSNLVFNGYLALIDSATGGNLTSFQAISYDPTTSLLWFVPTSNFTGRVDILMALADPVVNPGFTNSVYDTQKFSLTVLGNGCMYALAPTNIAVAAGTITTGTVAVTTGSACGWAASSSQGWLTIPAGTNGTGNGTVTYVVTTNTTVAPRTAQLLIAGQSLTVTQAGKLAAPAIITDTVLPLGGAGVAYQTALAAFGGTPAESWSIATGSLPAGLTLVASTGAITGTPTVATVASFTLRVTDTNGLSSTAPFSLTINVVPVPDINLTGSLNFSAIPVNTTTQQTVTIANTGNAMMNVSGISYPSGFSGAFSGSIAAGSATNVVVTFAPTAMASYGGPVTVSSDAAGGTNTLTAAGIGTAAPLRLIGLTGNLAFGSVTVGTGAQRTLTVANTGDATLTVSGISYPSGFSGTFSGSIAAGRATNVTVTFAPAQVTSYGGTVVVSSDANGGNDTIGIAGTGAPLVPVITVAPVVSNALLQVNNRSVVVAGDTNVFSVGATGSNSLSYQWNFGDGVTEAWSPTSTVTHVYSTTTCGAFVASVTMSNGTSEISSNIGIMVACPLTITKLQATVNFAKTNSDTCTLAATMNLGTKYSLTNKVVTLDIGGAQVTFKLDAKGKGRGVGPYGSCSLTFNKPSGLYVLTASLAKGFWQITWHAAGMLNKTIHQSPPTVVILPVTVVVDVEAFANDDRRLLYTATYKKTGTAK